MAVKTWSELHQYIQQYFTENFDEDITGEQLRVFLTNLLDTVASHVVSGIEEVRRGRVNVTTAGTLVTFKAEFENDYVIWGKVMAGTSKVGHYEYNRTTTGLMVKPVINGVYEYIAVPL